MEPIDLDLALRLKLRHQAGHRRISPCPTNDRSDHAYGRGCRGLRRQQQRPARRARLIASTYKTFSALGQPAAPEPKPKQVKISAAQIRESVSPEALVSFEDGRSYKTLKRHLSARGMTVAQYRAKWGLPADYPSTAPSYSGRRSALARSVGLGRKAAPSLSNPPSPSPAAPKAIPVAPI